MGMEQGAWGESKKRRAWGMGLVEQPPSAILESLTGRLFHFGEPPSL